MTAEPKTGPGTGTEAPDAWREIRGGLDDAVRELRQAVKRAASKFE